jgi:DNA-binding MarR family transcriptional regulator
MSWVFDYSDATKGERLVLLALANHRNGDTGLCCPGVELLARETRLSHSATWRAIQRLEGGGHIEVERSKGRGNRYRIVGYEQARNAPSALEDRARLDAELGALEPETRRVDAPLTSNQEPLEAIASQEERTPADIEAGERALQAMRAQHGFAKRA